MREDMIIDTYIPWRSFFAMCMYVCEDVSMHTSAYMLYTCIPCTHILFSLCMCPYIYAKRMEACVLDWVGGRREGTGKAAAGCDGGYAVLKLQTAISRMYVQPSCTCVCVNVRAVHSPCKREGTKACALLHGICTARTM